MDVSTILRKHALHWAVAATLTLAIQPGGLAQAVPIATQAGSGDTSSLPPGERPQGKLAGAPTNGVVPQPPPTAQGRRRIGMAFGGGGALALSEVGVLQWMDEHHVPIDVVAGTSMGSLIGALYATGHTPQQMLALTSNKVFSQVFRISEDFSKENFRRREDSRFLPGGIHVGLRKGVSLRNGVLLDSGLNQFLNSQFLPYGAAYDFNKLPLPFRCVATDILVGQEAIFTHGPLAEAVRASISIPGVFQPLEDGGHIYVDGALTENLPTQVVKDELHADVVLAISLPLTPATKGDTSSVLGVLQRSFSVASWSNEVRSRSLADVLIEPVAPLGLDTADYSAADRLAKAGYDAAEKVGAKLLAYRLSDAEWEEYQARRQAREVPPLRNFAAVNVAAPSTTLAIGVRDTMINVPGKPVNADTVAAKLDEVRSDGRFRTYYFLSTPGQTLDMHVTGPAADSGMAKGRELLHPEEKRGAGSADTPEQEQVPADGRAQAANSGSNPVNDAKPQTKAEKEAVKKLETVAPASATRTGEAHAGLPAGVLPQPGDMDLNVVVRDRPGGPPYLLIGGNVIAQTGGTARATIDGIVTEQDFGGYGSELRARFRFGFLTEFQPEYYRKLADDSKWFVAPRLQLYRSPVYIWADQKKVAERLSLTAGGGFDFGYAQSHYTEWRAGWQRTYQEWHTTTGNDGRPNLDGSAQLARVLYRYNDQDRAMIPQHGLRADLSAGYQFGAVGSQNAPRLQAAAAYFRDIGHGNTLSFSLEGGTFARRRIADPFLFTLGGPLRLTASAYEEYRGTDYGFVLPAYFRRIASLPAPLGQSIYVLGTYEYGHIETLTGPVDRQDVFFGLAAETPLGAITFGPAFGNHDHRKLVFTLGRFF